VLQCGEQLDSLHPLGSKRRTSIGAIGICITLFFFPLSGQALVALSDEKINLDMFGCPRQI
jgi:hypothetical protein